MSKFTVVNLSEVEDVVGERAPGMEGRFARKHMGSKELGVSFFRYGPNVRSRWATPTRCRRRPTWSSDGSGRVKIDDEIIGPEEVGHRAGLARRRSGRSRAAPRASR